MMLAASRCPHLPYDQSVLYVMTAATGMNAAVILLYTCSQKLKTNTKYSIISHSEQVVLSKRGVQHQLATKSRHEGLIFCICCLVSSSETQS